LERNLELGREVNKRKERMKGKELLGAWFKVL